MDANRIISKLEELRRKKRQQTHIRESYRRKLLKRRVLDAVDEYLFNRETEEEVKEKGEENAQKTKDEVC